MYILYKYIYIYIYRILDIAIFSLILSRWKKSPIPYSAVNSRVIPSFAYVAWKRRCRNMGRTRAIRIERCFWGTVDEQVLDQAVFGDRGGEGRPAAIRRLSVFAFRVSRYIRMLSSNEKKATFMTHESRFSRLLIFHLYNGSSIVLFVRFVLHLLLIASIKRITYL